MQLATFHQKLKNLDDFERDESDAHLGRARLLNVKEKGKTICYIMNRCSVMFLRGEKVNVVQQILTMNSLNAKHQIKSSNQLAFHLSAYTHL